jgi:threonine/homoserine/homoserine lactone efflux protein
VFGGSLGDLLPLAIGIAISPIPIIACILMLFSARARVNGPAFLVGWVLGVAVVTTLVVVLSDASAATDDSASGPSLGDLVILLLGIGAILLGLRQWRGRPKPGEDPAMPSWMAAIDGFAPGKAFGFGFLLSAVNPKNLGLAAAAGLVIDEAVANGGNAPAMEVVFVVLASLSIAVPVVYMLVGGDGAKKTLDGWRTWLTAHNAAVMAVLFIVIGAKLVGSGLDAIVG